MKAVVQYLKRHQKRFALFLVFQIKNPVGEYHPDGYQKQNDAAGNTAGNN